MGKDYNSIVMAWRREKSPKKFSNMFKMLISAFDSPIDDNDFPDLIIMMQEIVTNLGLVEDFMDDEEFNIFLNENLSNSEGPELLMGEKIADLILNKLFLPHSGLTIEKWINQLIEILWFIYDEGLSEELDDIDVVFEKIGNYLVLQRRDKESVGLLQALKDRDHLDNYAYWNNNEIFDGLLYLALEKENDTLGCLVTEAFENLCGMDEEGWEKFFPFMLQMHGGWINKDDIDPEEFDVDFLNAIKGTKYEEIIRKEFPDLYEEDKEEESEDKENDTDYRISCTNDDTPIKNESLEIRHHNTNLLPKEQQGLVAEDCDYLICDKLETEKKKSSKNYRNTSGGAKATSSNTKYRPKGIKGHFYGLYKFLKGKSK